MHRRAIIVICLTILGACGGPKTTEGAAGASETGPASSAVAAPAGTKAPRPDVCQAFDTFIYDLLVVGKARTQSPAKKQEVLTTTGNHAKALTTAAPELGLAVEVRVAYAQAMLAGDPSREAKDREATARAQFDDWSTTHGCG